MNIATASQIKPKISLTFETFVLLHLG